MGLPTLTMFCHNGSPIKLRNKNVYNVYVSNDMTGIVVILVLCDIIKRLPMSSSYKYPPHWAMLLKCMGFILLHDH